jgi:hypothetical protein
MIITKRLDSPELIEDACALLNEVYVKQWGWSFSSENPSQLRVEIRNNRHVLVDRFTEKAVWFGAFDDLVLVGCVRLIFADEHNKFETEAYKSSHVIQEYLPVDKTHCVEINRLAIADQRNKLEISKQLFSAAFQYCEDNQCSILGASNYDYIIALFKDIGFPLKIEYAFKYEAHDSLPVNFYFADYGKEEIKKILGDVS